MFIFLCMPRMLPSMKKALDCALGYRVSVNFTWNERELVAFCQKKNFFLTYDCFSSELRTQTQVHSRV